MSSLKAVVSHTNYAVKVTSTFELRIVTLKPFCSAIYEDKTNLVEVEIEAWSIRQF